MQQRRCLAESSGQIVMNDLGSASNDNEETFIQPKGETKTEGTRATAEGSVGGTRHSQTRLGVWTCAALALQSHRCSNLCCTSGYSRAGSIIGLRPLDADARSAIGKYEYLTAPSRRRTDRRCLLQSKPRNRTLANWRSLRLKPCGFNISSDLRKEQSDHGRLQVKNELRNELNPSPSTLLSKVAKFDCRLVKKDEHVVI
jgi:hypothetical protein